MTGTLLITALSLSLYFFSAQTCRCSTLKERQQRRQLKTFYSHCRATLGLHSSRAWWPLAPNICPLATRKSQIFHTNHVGHPRFYSFRALGSLQFSLEHSLAERQANLKHFCCCFQSLIRLKILRCCNLSLQNSNVKQQT